MISMQSLILIAMPVYTDIIREKDDAGGLPPHPLLIEVLRLEYLSSPFEGLAVGARDASHIPGLVYEVFIAEQSAVMYLFVRAEIDTSGRTSPLAGSSR
jgi:hypothetical protein